jgi:hypothetical protein
MYSTEEEGDHQEWQWPQQYEQADPMQMVEEELQNIPDGIN